jgi:hypothetical protein
MPEFDNKVAISGLPVLAVLVIYHGFTNNFEFLKNCFTYMMHMNFNTFIFFFINVVGLLFFLQKLTFELKFRAEISFK